QTTILPMPEAFLELHRPIRLVPQAVAVPPIAASPLAAPAADTDDSYVKLKAEAVPAGVTSIVIQPKSEPIMPAPATPARKIPLSLPLRGPIELDPAAVNLLEGAPTPASTNRPVQVRNQTNTQGTAGAPLPTGRP